MDDKWDEKSARAMITRNGGKFRGRQIIIKQPGIKVLGVIDYLVHQHKYIWFKPEVKDG
jgi:hypothetical protein